MQAELWRRVESLYHAALSQPPEKRSAFVEQACPDDAEVRAEVQSLLDQADDSFLETSALTEIVRPGITLGNFQIIERIGRGGMGEVWRAHDSRLKRDVAIKLLPLALARDPDRVARFEIEARAASALNHPNIVSVYDIGSENGVYWIVSELVDGESLRGLIERGPLPPRRAVEIGSQIADGLAAAHAAGIVHRDLKPSNIMLHRDGRVKIIDFGLAKTARPALRNSSLTDSGVVLGTAGYMSPEQVRSEATDARSDIFSLGVILHEMLAGQPAFRGASSVELMNAILKDDPPQLPTSTPAGLHRIVRRCLEKEPAYRFQGAADLGFALSSLTELAGPSLARPKTTRKDPRIRWALLAASVVALAAAYSWWRIWPKPQPLAVPGNMLVRLTGDAGLTIDAAISTDGKLVAYASDRADSSNLDIWVQQVDGGRAIRLTEDPADDDQPAFSPDGTQIVFHSNREGGGIYVVPALGGEAHLLVPRGQHPAISPDGQKILYWIGVSDKKEGNGWFVRGFPSGDARPIGLGPGCFYSPDGAIWSPDSTRVMFYADCGRPGAGVIWVSGVDGKSPVASPLGNVYLTRLEQWLAGPSRILFAGPTVNGSSFVTIPISEDGLRITGPGERVTLSTGLEKKARAGSTGRIVLSSLDSQQQIWGVPINAQGHLAGEPKQLTTGRQDDAPSIARDGKRMVFKSTEPVPELFYQDLATGKEQGLSPEINNPDSLCLSADGTKAMYFSAADSSDHLDDTLWEVPIPGGVPKRLWHTNYDALEIWDFSGEAHAVLFHRSYGAMDAPIGAVQALDLKTYSESPFLHDPEYDAWNAHFSPDGRWVTFNAEREGRSTVFVVPFGKGVVPRSNWIPIAEGDKPRFSSDGRTIFFASIRDGFWCIWAQPLGPGMRPTGGAFAVYHMHSRRGSLAAISISALKIAVGANMIVFTKPALSGNIWILNPYGPWGGGRWPGQ